MKIPQQTSKQTYFARAPFHHLILQLNKNNFLIEFLGRHYETSAATGEGVDRLFSDMLTGLIERKKLWKAKSANPSI